jgi:hypothetical protein
MGDGTGLSFRGSRLPGREWVIRRGALGVKSGSERIGTESAYSLSAIGRRTAFLKKITGVEQEFCTRKKKTRILSWNCRRHYTRSLRHGQKTLCNGKTS